MDLRGAIRLIANKKWNTDMLRRFVEDSDRDKPELEGDMLNVFDGQNITAILAFRTMVRDRVRLGETAQLEVEFEEAINPAKPPNPMDRGGLTNADLDYIAKAISHNSQRGIFQGKVETAVADGKAIGDALSKSFGVYPDWSGNFSRWGQTWGGIVQSFLGLVALVKMVREGGLTPEDVRKYKDDKDTFQGDFSDLEDQPHFRAMLAWDLREYELLHFPDLAGNRPAGAPLFWSEVLAKVVTEDIFGGVITVDQSNFLRHKDLAEEVLAKQTAIRQFFRGVDVYLRDKQDVLGPDTRLATVIPIAAGAVLGLVGASLLGLPGDQAWSLLPGVILAILGGIIGSRLQAKIGVLEMVWTGILVIGGSCAVGSSSGLTEHMVTSGQITQAAASARAASKLVGNVTGLGAVWLAGVAFLRWLQRKR